MGGPLDEFENLRAFRSPEFMMVIGVIVLFVLITQAPIGRSGCTPSHIISISVFLLMTYWQYTHVPATQRGKIESSPHFHVPVQQEQYPILSPPVLSPAVGRIVMAGEVYTHSQSQPSAGTSGCAESVTPVGRKHPVNNDTWRMYQTFQQRNGAIGEVDIGRSASSAAKEQFAHRNKLIGVHRDAMTKSVRDTNFHRSVRVRHQLQLGNMSAVR